MCIQTQNGGQLGKKVHTGGDHFNSESGFWFKNVSVSLCNKTADEKHAEQSYECSQEKVDCTLQSA